ncbi:MAG TPA: glycosyltransferase [Thermodesulfobacteriota bacterium]|nr:glycosyltransferase [Thermodesulfobacteriota bacterium]
MAKKILLGCYEVPGYGGASTSSYNLFEMMQNDGLDVCYLNLIDEQDVDYYRYVFGENFGNPKSMTNVYNCVLKGSWHHPHPELNNLINYLSPDILVGKGYIAAFLMKRAAPKKRNIFITSGCQQVRDYIAKKKAKDVISLGEIIKHAKHLPVLLPGYEIDAIRISDLIVTHSDMTMFLFEYFFPPSQIAKIYTDVIWSAEWIYKDALDYLRLKKPFFERNIDILFIASAWSRPEKNYKLVKKIVLQCKGLNIHIVGEVEEKLVGVKHYGLITKREELFILLGNAKTIVCTSLFDPAPGILFEASAMGCNIIASKNCGNWQICNEELLVDPFNLNNFLEKIFLSLTKKFHDNIDYFLKTKSYQNLIDTILVF